MASQTHIGHYALTGLLAAFALATLFGAANGEDLVYKTHMTIFFIASVAIIYVIVGKIYGGAKKAANRLAVEVNEGGTVDYNMDVVRFLALIAVFWGLVGMLVGLVLALQLTFPVLNFDVSFLNFGRLRPVHTSGVIFAFGGNVLLATSFYVVQRTSRARLIGNLTPWFVAIGFQLFLLQSVIGYLMGGTQGKEYAEPVWYLDLFLTVIWVLYLVLFAGTLMKRKEKHIYVSNWYFLALIGVVAILHLGNGAQLPVSLLSSQSYSVYSGVQDAMVQWWYGHNAVGFFLSAGFLGIMYYFVPKQAQRPIYSYRLSVVSFWALVFIYIWAGPHHLHYTALPDWTQVLGAGFSIMLWIPSWGSAVNGVMTLNGAWDKLRTDPTMRMLVIAVAFYAMSTFEGPLMSIRAVNSLSHYTDWTVGHVHSGALGWVAMVSFGALYYMIPRLCARKDMYSTRLIEWHFWLSMLGIVLYITSMWISGIMQGLMWRAWDSLGFLEYSFIETVEAMHPFYFIRALGGLMFVAGMVLMCVNVWMTVRIGKAQPQRLAQAAPAAAPAE